MELYSCTEYFDIQGNGLDRSDKNEHSWKRERRFAGKTEDTEIKI